MENKFLRQIVIACCIVFPISACSVDSNTVIHENEPTHPQDYYQISSDGKLQQPEGYREWIYVGTPLTPNDLNPPEAPFPEFHNVYIDPVSWDHYKQTGEFLDGTIIVKELVLVGTKQAVSGNGYFMGDFVGLEATIKNSTHFPDEPGNWAYFSFGHSYPLAKTAEAFPTAACNTCHQVSAATDFVFTQYYPVLRSRSASVVEATAPMTMDEPKRASLESAMETATANISEPRAPTGVSSGLVPTDTDALFTYLQSGDYRNWSQQESTPHGSRGPHTRFGLPVKVFMTDDISVSLKAGNTSHPAGAAIIKEMFGDDAETLTGWAVMVKTQDDSADGNGWFWYEVLSTTDSNKIAGDAGNGIPLCTSCHTTGLDFVLTDFPLM